jgi:hypothetical protein
MIKILMILLRTKCELLNKYFSSISKLDEENVTLPQFDSKTNNIIHEIHITENEIIDVIQILDPNKATEPDKISHKMLKISPEKIAKPLLIIFNKSVQQSKYPSNWKSAHVIAIFKKGDTSLPSNYRPISLISCVGTLMERIVYKHVYNHLVNNSLIYKYQSGFFPKHSTVHFVFCDFSKAFEKVWHKGLIHKMNSYGIQGKLIKWFENYLFKRRQKVINKNSWSSFEPVSAGVPQGSVVGPLMFLIYINDIGEKFISLSRLFADDTSLGYSIQSVDQIKTVINDDLLELNAWSSKWIMSFNPENTEISFFSNTGNIDTSNFLLMAKVSLYLLVISIWELSLPKCKME